MNSQASRLLPIPAGPRTETRRARCSRPVAWNSSLRRRSSSARPTNGASSASVRLRPPRSATTRSGAPGGDGEDLALEGLLAGGLEGDRPAGGPLGRLADEDRAGGGDRLEAGGGVDEVARDHPLVGGPEGHRGLAGQDPRPGRDAGTQDPDRVDELEPGAHRPLGVVLPGDRGSPDRHDRVADELLDRPPVAGDDVGGDLEVAGQGVADVLRVALLGERREADQVGEQDRHEAALGDGRRRGGPRGSGRAHGHRRGPRGAERGGGPRGGSTERRGAFAAELGRRRVDRSARRAADRQACRALRAELRPDRVRGPAVRADQSISLVAPIRGMPKRTRHRSA